MSHGPRIIDVEQMTAPSSGLFARLPVIGLALAAAGIGASFAMRGDGEQFYFSWLVAFLYFLSLGLGALFFVLIQFVTKTGWGVVVRRVAENASAALVAVAIAFVPVYAGLTRLYHWTDTEHVAHDPVLSGKGWYLNPGRFLAFAIAYFAIWVALAWIFRSGSVRQDASGDENITRRLIKISGPAIIVLALTSTFAAFDWGMSLTPHWYSTIFGVYYFAGSLVCAFAFISLAVLALRRAGKLTDVVTTEHLHDLGKLLFAFIVFWAYIGFSQFFLIWYANIPEETEWYLGRLSGSWHTVTVALAVGHFVVPFFLLMSRHVKRNPLGLAAFSIFMLVMHYVDLHWIVMPTLHQEGFAPALLDVTTMIGVGGLFLAAFGFFSTRAKLVPVRDPRLIESISFKNF